jgi:hypothetical protein
MRIAALSLVGAVCLAASALAANAAPAAPSPASRPGHHVIQAAGGCGWGFHRNRWHRCVPVRYGHYNRPYWRGFYGPYYGGYYGGGYYGRGGQDQNGISWRDHFSGGY